MNKVTDIGGIYCVPQDPQEWASIGLSTLEKSLLGKGIVDYAFYDLSNEKVTADSLSETKDMRWFKKLKEVSVRHFNDVLYDRIKVWRVMEIGFMQLEHAEEELCYYLPFKGGNFSIFCVFDILGMFKYCEVITGNANSDGIELHVSGFSSLRDACVLFGKNEGASS